MNQSPTAFSEMDKSLTLTLMQGDSVSGVAPFSYVNSLFGKTALTREARVVMGCLADFAIRRGKIAVCSWLESPRYAGDVGLVGCYGSTTQRGNWRAST